ncbi:hypothetical protein RHGRI_009588 [Rhododendron griersonianum]|uniref:Uncharacterized protein n=1 Tax=Rhododendron griersonianum TaxID=479676 RepID=A0AAV6KG05_9ERIC|nr:hypothetical protein RHGRI_009588 [Rhododendron griersonianum]
MMMMMMMMNVVVALFLVLSSLVVTAEPEASWTEHSRRHSRANRPPEDAMGEHSAEKVKQVLDRARDVREHAKEAVSKAFGKAKDFVPRTGTGEVSNKAKDAVRAACQISYDFGQTAAAKVGSAVAEKVGTTVNQYVPDERGRAKIGRFATSFVRNAAVYGLPEVLKYWVPGGVPVYYIASRSLRDVKTEDFEDVKTKTEHYEEAKTKTELYEEELKRLRAEVDKLERKLSGGGQNIQDDVKLERESSVGKDNQADAEFESGAASCLNSNVHLKEDDTIGMCMMKEFSGMCYDEGI